MKILARARWKRLKTQEPIDDSRCLTLKGLNIKKPAIDAHTVQIVILKTRSILILFSAIPRLYRIEHSLDRETLV